MVLGPAVNSCLILSQDHFPISWNSCRWQLPRIPFANWKLANGSIPFLLKGLSLSRWLGLVNSQTTERPLNSFTDRNWFVFGDCMFTSSFWFNNMQSTNLFFSNNNAVTTLLNGMVSSTRQPFLIQEPGR